MGVKVNLRKPAVFLPVGWCHFAARVDVSKSLALANNLFRVGDFHAGWGVGIVFKATRLSSSR